MSISGDSPKPVRINLEGEAPHPRLPAHYLVKHHAVIDADKEELVRSLGPWHVRKGCPSDRWSLCACTWGPEEPKNDLKPWGSRTGSLMYLHNLIVTPDEGEKVWALNGDLLDCRSQNLRKHSKERVTQEYKKWEAYQLRRARGGKSTKKGKRLE